MRRFAQFHDAAGSWSRVERIIARVEAGAEGTDTRFIVTNLEGGRAKQLYERLYCARGQAENHIKAWKNHLAADRTSCHEATANQFRASSSTLVPTGSSVDAPVDAQGLGLARHAVRHAAAAPHQDRRPR